MNRHQIVATTALAGMLFLNLGRAAETDAHFLRLIGAMNLGDARTSTHLAAEASKTNAYPLVTVTWHAGNVTESSVKPMMKAGWFVFAEHPARIWVFDGQTLSLVERSDKALSDSSSVEAFKKCPKAVRDALPEQVRKKYFH